MLLTQRRRMEVRFSDIFHLEIFRVGDEDFIKDIHLPAKGNAKRRFGKRDYVFFQPETLVQRREPFTPIKFAD